MIDKANKVVLKIFDKRSGHERRVHNCDLCQTYKREAAKGDMDALKFYKSHINHVVKKYGGVTLVFDAKKNLTALAGVTIK